MFELKSILNLLFLYYTFSKHILVNNKEEASSNLKTKVADKDTKTFASQGEDYADNSVCAQGFCCGSDGKTHGNSCDTPKGVSCIDYNECPDPVSIKWFFGMKPVDICVTPGTNVTFNGKNYHSVFKLNNEEEFDNCDYVPDSTAVYGNYTLTAGANLTTYFMVCGSKYHCSVGKMKAKITVAKTCTR